MGKGGQKRERRGSRELVLCPKKENLARMLFVHFLLSKRVSKIHQHCIW